MQKEAEARLIINKLLEESGWIRQSNSIFQIEDYTRLKPMLNSRI
jgi:hypothetical protein